MMNVHHQITLKVPMKVQAHFRNQSLQANVGKPSPQLAFASGPGFETKPLELDLRNLPSADSPDLDNSLRDILLENMKIGNVVSEDNEDTVSEVSTCSSAVALETVDETESSNTTPATGNRKKTRATSFTAGISTKSTEGSNYLSSSEAEEEESRKGAMKKSKKIISDLFNFNTPSFGGNGVSEESEELKPPTERKRKLSITKRISPLSLSTIFAGSQSSSNSKQETHNEKETKKTTQSKATRKLSLTIFHKPEKEKETRKRRNTDPQLPPKAQGTAQENEEKKGEEETTLARNDSEIRLIPEKAFFKEEDMKIHGLIQHVLRAHLLSMKEYKRETCDRVCKSICNILKTLVVSLKEAEHAQCKVVCQAYVGAVREEGMFASTQSLWDNEKDNFAAASYRHDSLFGLASVVTNHLC